MVNNGKSRVLVKDNQGRETTAASRRLATPKPPLEEGVMRDISIILVGCGTEIYRAARRHLPHYGYECSNEDSFRGLAELIQQKKPIVVILGPESIEEGITQTDILKRVKELDRSTPVMYITDSNNTDSAEIIRAGADDIISQDHAKPKALGNRIGTVLSLHEADCQEHSSEPVFCEIREGRLNELEKKSASGAIKKTMDEFAFHFDLHQKHTRHYAVMNAILTVYPHHFGTEIIDVGCGTAHPMRQYIRNIMIPEFAASPPKRDNTRILSLDNTESMLVRAKRGYEKLLSQGGRLLQGRLEPAFLLADILEVTVENLSKMGFERPDTILASYLAHWVIDKEATVRKMSELLPVGGKLITVEEWPPVVTPGPHMPPEQVELIERNILPIERKRYYGMLMENGFEVVKDGVVVLKIDGHHDMYGNVFEKVKGD